MLKDHNVVTPVRLESATPRSPVKHSTTVPLRSLFEGGAADIVLLTAKLLKQGYKYHKFYHSV